MRTYSYLSVLILLASIFSCKKKPITTVPPVTPQTIRPTLPLPDCIYTIIGWRDLENGNTLLVNINMNTGISSELPTRMELSGLSNGVYWPSQNCYYAFTRHGIQKKAILVRYDLNTNKVDTFLYAGLLDKSSSGCDLFYNKKKNRLYSIVRYSDPILDEYPSERLCELKIDGSICKETVIYNVPYGSVIVSPFISRTDGCLYYFSVWYASTTVFEKFDFDKGNKEISDTVGLGENICENHKDDKLYFTVWRGSRFYSVERQTGKTIILATYDSLKGDLNSAMIDTCKNAYVIHSYEGDVVHTYWLSLKTGRVMNSVKTVEYRRTWF